MKAKFIGDPTHPNEQVPDLHDAFGLTFPAGKYVEIPEHLEAKVAGSSHFHVQGAKDDKPEETAESTAAFATRINAITDRDGLEAMLKDEKRPAARSVIERRLEALPAE